MNGRKICELENSNEEIKCIDELHDKAKYERAGKTDTRVPIYL